MKTWMLLFLLSFSLLTSAQDTARVYFEFDRYELREEAKQEADRFIAAYKSGNKNLPLVIKGFCDIIGPHSYNDQLSEHRTIAVQQYLVQNGIPLTAISLRKGYGKRLPVNENRTSEERQENRRVEIIILEPITIKSPVVTETTRQPPADFSKTIIDSINVGENLRLRNINFVGGRHDFLPQAMEPLQELLDVLKKHPGLVIEIQGHICCQTNPAFDGLDHGTGEMSLSVNRARAVYDYLLSNGIDPKRLTYRGFSRQFPLVDPEITEEEKTMNRRVEIKILKK